MKTIAVSRATAALDGNKNNQSLFKQNNTTPVIKTPAPTKNTGGGLNKNLPIISSAIAITSLGVAAFAIAKNPKNLKNIEGKLDILTRELTENKRTQETIKTAINESKNIAYEAKNRAENSVRSVREELNNLHNGLNDVKGAVKAPVLIHNGGMTRDVEVNGMHMQLGTVQHGYGIHENDLTNQLRSESTRRILGAVKPIELPENAMIRIPTAEFQGLTKTGGLAVVPRELTANLGAVMNNKQKAELIVDTPLYIGQVENNQFLDIVKVKDNHFNYIKKQDGKETTIAKLTKIDEMELEILTDTGKEKETVGVYLSDEMKQAVSFEETLAQFDPKEANKIQKSLAAGKNVHTELVDFIAPKGSTAKVDLITKGADGKPESITVNFNKVLKELEPEEAQKIKEYHAIGKDYEIKMENFVLNKGNQMKLFDDATAGKISKQIDAGRIAQEEARQKAIEEGKNPESAAKKVAVPTLKLLAPQPAKAEVKFKTVLYENRKFHMDGPVWEGKDKNIYDGDTIQSKETERFVYFNKFMYENLIQNHRSSDKPLKADWIIGNDWHTGPLSAMTRLLTPTRKAMGMEPEKADKIYNTPITTLMHNFKLQGATWENQPKLVNVMFGEHAAKVTENAWMPQKADMPGSLMNGLFSDHALNPQTMAMAYSDDVIFVSRGNFAEASGITEKGGTNFRLASLRGRTHQFQDRNRLEEIGMAYGIRPNEIPETPTAKGITNGCDRVNNVISQAKARKLEEQLHLKIGSIKSEEEALKDPYGVHQHNKKVYLNKLMEDINLAKKQGTKNDIKLVDPEHTDLTGVDENTMVFGMAGRIVDQKGIDIHAEGIRKFYERGNYNRENPPVFYLQGKGEQKYIDRFIEVKNWLRERDPKASDRMVFAGLFSEAGRYDGCKMMSDFSGMPSWDEPCGLVHKEIGYNSGSISIVNKVGGLTDGLKGFIRGADKETNKGANSIFVDFKDKDMVGYDSALAYNAEKTADAFETAQELFNDKESFAEAIKESYLSRHDWLRGKIQEYVEIGQRHGVIDKKVDSKYTL